MNRIAKFEKVSLEQFKTDWNKEFQDSEEQIVEIYNNLRLPSRATSGSAGYDFFSPISLHFEPKEKIKIPTGIRVKIQTGWVLQLFPRSSLGFKTGLKLANTVGIIDSDYYGAKNEGHMLLSLVNDNNEHRMLDVEAGSGLVQGIFTPFGITEDDETDTARVGGFGSTNKYEIR